MTTKQILLSALILGTIGNNALATKETSTDTVFKDGWYNKLNGEFLSFAIISPRKTELNNIKIIEKLPNCRFLTFLTHNTIGLLKKYEDYGTQKAALQHITSNNAIVCGDTIVLNSTDPNDCEILRNDYEEFKSYTFLQKKTNATQ